MIHRDEYWSRARQAAETLGAAGLAPVDVAVQCGSGLARLGGLLLRQPRAVDMDSVPYLPAAAVTGHGQQVLAGSVGGARVLVLTGRIHLYEGYTPAEAGLPAAIAKALGARAFIAINAAGGLNPHYRMGELMLHRDYLNLQGDNALAHLECSEPCERFLDMRQAYHPGLSSALAQGLAKVGGQLQHGVYAAVRGPVFETPAELAWMRQAGADAVGMSTVPEITICRWAGLPAAAVSVITNECLQAQGPEHGAILAAAESAIPILAAGLRSMLEDGGWQASLAANDG
jgi:purine-nucleoside phosphorylase